MKWNHIFAFEDVRDLIGLPGGLVTDTNRWWDGEHVPHWAVEKACGLGSDELKYSYIDGWFPLPRTWERETLEMRPRPRIRHCPECIKYGYHSVVFYFEHISHCPWHHLPLQYCQNCSDFLHRRWPVKKGFAGAAEACEHMKIVLDIVSPERLQKNHMVEMEEWCEGFRGWVKHAVKLIGQGAYEIVVAIPSQLQDEEAVFNYLAGGCLLGGSSPRIDPPFTILIIPRSKLVWEKRFHDFLRFPGIRTMIRDAIRAMQPHADILDVIATAKSIRRYIFRRYIKYHKKCFARLARATTSAWYTLDLEGACPCVMAYLITFSRQWGVSPWDLLHEKNSHSRSFNERFYGRGETLVCEAQVGMYKLIGDFYRIWSVLRHFKEINCRTLVLNYRNDGDHPSYIAPKIYESTRRHRDYIYWDALMFMENPDVALAESIPDCVSRRRQPLQVRLQRWDYSVLSKNKNILCALHYCGANNNLRLDL
ncbi:hypothetical protein ACIPZG_05500 [Pseudomonas sp. NPDC089395]|uniref:hypothetical protein n=2 Tax=unclassified Pseudomonas TaxID=196821 RepID=UPI0037FD0A93